MAELKKIKNVINEMCMKENQNDLYKTMCDILDYIRTHENMVSNLRNENIKDMIENMRDG